MTDAQRIARVQSYFDAGALSDTEAQAYLAQAKDAVLDQLYISVSNYPEDAAVPRKYEGAWCELAAFYFARKGGLGETQHIENGIHRNWYSSDGREILARVVPFAVVR